MSKFKVGMKVKSLENSIDITRDKIYEIVQDSDDVIFNDNVGELRNRVSKDYEIVEEPKPISSSTKSLSNTIITNITSPEQHKRVQEKLFGIGCEWDSTVGKNNIKSVFEPRLKDEHICIRDKNEMIYISDLIHRKEYDNFRRIPASEFLGEEENPQTYPLDYTYGLKLQPSKSLWYSEGIVERIEELKNYNMPKDEPSVIKGNNKIMENIVSFFNDLTVSSEDKELRKAGLLDSNLSWTESALQIVKDLEAKERGYKDFNDLKNKLCNDNSQGRLSILEGEVLYKKFYTKLLETAKKFNIKNEKKNK